MSIAQQAIAAVAIAQPAGERIVLQVPQQRQTVATPEAALVPTAR